MGTKMKKILLALVLNLNFPGAFASAEEGQVYTLERTKDGYVRTNTKTGATSICTEKGDQLVCRMSVDDQAAYETDVAALEAKIENLEKRLAMLEKAGSKTLQQPETEMEFQTSLNRMEQFFRRFMGIVKEFQHFGAEPTPDRTSL